MGCVLPAGLGQAPARQAGFAAGLGEEVPATTLNKMCGSGMKAAMMAFDQIALGHADTMVAGWDGKHDERALSFAEKCAAGRGSDMGRWSITCFWTGSKTPMTRAA